MNDERLSPRSSDSSSSASFDHYDGNLAAVLAASDISLPLEDPAYIEALETSQREASNVADQGVLQAAFVSELLEAYGWETRHSVDDGNCLFASCLDGQMTAEELRRRTYEYIQDHRGEFIEEIQNVLREDVDAIIAEQDDTKRNADIQKLPETLQETIDSLTNAHQEMGQACYFAVRDNWLVNQAFDDYVEGMKVGYKYPGLLEVRVLAEIIGHPIRVFTREYGPMDSVPTLFQDGGDHPLTINIVYDNGRKHFDRLIPRALAMPSSSS